MDYVSFDDEHKAEVEQDIEADFQAALPGIRALPAGVRLGVYLAYVYYTRLFKKIRSVNAHIVKANRIRVADTDKLWLLCSTALRHRLNLL